MPGPGARGKLRAIGCRGGTGSAGRLPGQKVGEAARGGAGETEGRSQPEAARPRSAKARGRGKREPKNARFLSRERDGTERHYRVFGANPGAGSEGGNAEGALGDYLAVGASLTDEAQAVVTRGQLASPQSERHQARRPVSRVR